jgi:hypothetical protein
MCLLLQQAVTFGSESQARYVGHTSLTFDEFTLLATPLLEQQVQHNTYLYTHIVITELHPVLSYECTLAIAALAHYKHNAKIVRVLLHCTHSQAC